MGAQRRSFRLLDAAEDAAALTLAPLGPLLFGDGLGPLPGTPVHTVIHGVMSNTGGMTRGAVLCEFRALRTFFQRVQTFLASMAYRIPRTTMTPSRPRASVWALLSLAFAACSANAPDQPALSASKLPLGRASTALRANDVPESVRQLSSRAPENREESAGPTPGSRLVRIRDGFAEVLVGRANPDGTVSTRCVDSGEAADAFLNETPSSGLLKAEQ
jgi:hypothetical protein